MRLITCSSNMLFFCFLEVLSNGFYINASTPVNTTLSDNLKTVFKFAGSKLPPSVSGSGIEALVELFWPEGERNVWDEVLDNIRYLIDPETFAQMNILHGRLIEFGRQLAEVGRDIWEGKPDAAQHYMKIARELIGLEKKCIISNHPNASKLNFHLLPLYSNIVLMKAAYYSLGLKCNVNIKLTLQNVGIVMRYFNDTIRLPKTGANDRILKLFQDQQDLPPNRRYDKIMLTRNAFKQHGYVSIWNNMIDHPGQEFVDDGLIYSRLLGAETDKLVEYARAQPSKPLTPDLLPDGTFNTLVKLEYSLSPLKSNDSLSIKGMKLAYENGFTYESGDNKPGNLPFTGTVLFNHSQYRVSSINFQSERNSLSSLSVEMETLRTPSLNYYTLGSVLVNSPSEIYENGQNLILQVPSGYKVGSMYFHFDKERLLHFAMSFVPDRKLNNTDVRRDWKEWQC